MEKDALVFLEVIKGNVRTSDRLKVAFFYPRCIMHCDITMNRTEPSDKAPECKTCSTFHGQLNRSKGQKDVTTVIIEVQEEIKSPSGIDCG